MNNAKQTVIEELKKHNSFLILAHINPDADAMGSCFAMKRVLESMGKTATVYLQEKLPKHLKFLPGEYEVFSDGDVMADACICIDCGDIGRVGERAKLFDSTKISINIDHHYMNTFYADVNYVDDKACSAGEICYEIIKELTDDIDKETAMCLYSAICADTGGFKYSNTTPKSMRIAAELLEKGVPSAKINKLLFDTESYDILRLKAEIMGGIELFSDGAIGVVSLTRQMLERYNIDEKDIDNIVDLVRRVEGVELAISIKECKEYIKISMRSNEYIDVSKIAQHFGGGGHVRASGLMMKCDFETAKSSLLDEAKKAVKEYQK